jgi:tetratricopeptide (TPR) repeat protein
LYNTTFLENFKRDAQTKWAAYCVLAHEVGHHLNNHDFTETDVKKRKLLELAAEDHPDDAIADYDEAIRLDPKNIVAYIGRGHVKRKWGELEEAILDYDQAIKIDPKEGVAYGAKACCICEICEKEWAVKNVLSADSKKRLLASIPLFDKALDAPFNPLLEGYYLDATAFKASALSLLKK